LTVKDLDRCEAQDEILFEAGSSGLQVVVPPPDVQPDLLPQAPWAQARLAALAARLAPMDIMLLDQPLEASPEAKVLKLYAEAQTADLQGGNAILGGVWRLRLYPLESFPAGEPLVKVGLKYSGLFELSAPYQPGDAEAATLAYQGSALEKLVKTATDKGLDKAFH
jgi:hypothetical protein